MLNIDIHDTSRLRMLKLERSPRSLRNSKIYNTQSIVTQGTSKSRGTECSIQKFSALLDPEMQNQFKTHLDLESTTQNQSRVRLKLQKIFKNLEIYGTSKSVTCSLTSKIYLEHTQNNSVEIRNIGNSRNKIARFRNLRHSCIQKCKAHKDYVGLNK